MYTVFLTGGIGSGKSTAREVLRQRGARVIDLDEISHEILGEPEVQHGLAARFGSDILKGDTVDRALLAERAFTTPSDTAALNALTHPAITARLKELLSDTSEAGDADVTVVEVPLIEHADDMIGAADEIIAITCPQDVRRARAVARGMKPDDFDARDASQPSDAERAACATTVIANDSDEEALVAALNAWWDGCAARGWQRGATAAHAGTPLPCPAIAFVGRHNSGKTTLVEALIAELVSRGVDVGSVKHHGHKVFEIDVAGKDSWRHHAAGASETAVSAPDRFALIRDLDTEMEVPEIIGLMRPHDIVIVEGYRHSGIPTVEVMRAGNERDAVAAEEFIRAARRDGPLMYDASALDGDADRMPDGLTVGVVSDMPEVLEAARMRGLEAFGLDDIEALAAFVLRFAGSE